jgi:hypothetical protein
MNSRCLSMEQIAALRSVGDDHAAWDHLTTCARCAALALEYEAFLRAAPGDGADVAAANRRLAEFIAERIDRQTVSGGSAGRAARRGFLFERRRILVFGAAAVAMTVAALGIMRDSSGPEPAILRGDADGSRLATYSVRDGGSVPLMWAPVEGADAYRITILAENLDEMFEIGPFPDNTLVFVPSEHALKPGRYFWEVTALAGGDALASLGPAPLFVR